MVPLSQQFLYMVVTVGTGLVMGIVFDCYRVWRGLVKPHRLLTPITDFLLWVFLTGIAFGLLLFSNWGEVRAYVFIGLALGFFLYWRFCSHLFIKMCRRLFQWLAKLVNILIQVVIFPFSLVARLVVIPLGLINMVIRQVASATRAAWRGLSRPLVNWWGKRHPHK